MMQNGIENFYYIVAMGIDKSKDNLIRLSIQTAKNSSSSEGASEQSNDYKIYSVDCQSIDTGINILNNYLNKQINLTHCSAIVFSEEIAKDNIKDYVVSITNNIEIRPSCNIIVSSKSALDVLENVANSGEKFSSRLYEYILNSVDYTGYTVNATLSNFLSRTNNSKAHEFAIYSVVNDDTIQNYGTAIFHDNVMIGVLNPLQTTAYLIVENELKSCLITIDNPLEEGGIININLETIKSPKIDVNLINNTPFIHVEIDIKGSISSSGRDFDYISDSNIKKIEQKTNEYLDKLISNFFYTISKEYNSDIVNLYGYLAAKYLTDDQFEKVHWNEVFKDSYFDVEINSEIIGTHLFSKE